MKGNPKDGDSLIAAWRQSECDWHLPGAVDANCQQCGEPIWAAPTSVAKAKEDNFHLLCRQCFGKMVVGNVVEFRGRVRPNSPVPWKSKI